MPKDKREILPGISTGEKKEKDGELGNILICIYSSYSKCIVSEIDN